MDREHAEAVLARMHAVQGRLYAGEAVDDEVRALLALDQAAFDAIWSR